MTSKSLKILHVASNLDGGIGEVIHNLSAISHLSEVAVFESDTFNRNNFFNQVRGFSRYIISASHKFDVVHFHGAWTPHILALSKKLGAPTIVSPHGAFHPFSLRKSMVKKTVAKHLYMKRCYQKASCIQVLSSTEKNHLIDYGIKNSNICIVPNGLDFSIKAPSNLPLHSELASLSKGRRTFLSLSRLHPSKGIDLLIHAFHKLYTENPNVCLFIVGDGDSNYVSKLKNTVEAKNLGENVFFLGALFSTQKLVAYSSSDVFVLPSLCEGFGITVLEAYRQSLPVITTTRTPFHEIKQYSIGWQVDPTVEYLYASMKDACKLDPEQLKHKGLKGQKWAEENYSLSTVLKKMEDMYHSVSNE